LSERFLIDAQLPPGLVELFARAGHEAVHVADVGLHTADDAKISVFARRSGMLIVTKDEDFATMRRFSPSAPRVSWIRIGNATNRALWDRLQPVMDEIFAAVAAGEGVIEVR
jgi:predicted nuclease of predicted toxin-antitoxin system